MKKSLFYVISPDNLGKLQITSLEVYINTNKLTFTSTRTFLNQEIHELRQIFRGG